MYCRQAAGNSEMSTNNTLRKNQPMKFDLYIKEILHKKCDSVKPEISVNIQPKWKLALN